MSEALREAGEEIDAVYLWVDGADPSFRRSLQARLGGLPSPPASSSVGPRRFRDNGELRYSLRSVRRFAPWLRRIHVVTNGQKPRWLDASDPRISIVPHASLFADTSVLPTFNSNAIESQIHRIPGLTRRFVYFNDDLFLGRETTPGDFLTPSGGQYVYLQRTTVAEGTRDGGLVHDQAYAHTRRLAARLWERIGPPALPAHVPQLYDREVLRHLETLLPEEFHATARHGFRAADDLVLRILYACCLFAGAAGPGHEAVTLEWGSSRYSFVSLRRELIATGQAFRHIARERPQFFCINDDLDEVGRRHATLIAMRLFLRWYFPRAAPFEKR